MNETVWGAIFAYIGFPGILLHKIIVRIKKRK